LPKPSSFCADNFQNFLWQWNLTIYRQNMVFGTKAVAQNVQSNFSENDDETEQNLLRHLLYIGAFVHCENWLVKLTLVCPTSWHDY
jgi:hypothetical protein